MRKSFVFAEIFDEMVDNYGITVDPLIHTEYSIYMYNVHH